MSVEQNRAGEAGALERLAGSAKPHLAELPGGARAEVLAARQEALAHALALGLPSPRSESWKYTNLPRALRAHAFAPSREEDARASLDYVPSLLPGEGDCLRMLFLNGHFRQDQARLDGLPEGVRLESLGKLLERGSPLPEALSLFERERGSDALSALNAALGEDGLLLSLAPGVVLPRPLEVVFLGSLAERPIAYHPRLFVSLGAGASATLLEHHHGIGTEPYLANHVSELFLGQGAKLTHLRVQEETGHAFHLAKSRIRLEAGALYDSFALTSGAALSRHEIDLTLDGEGAEARLNGAYLLRAAQHADTTSVIEHCAPATTSRESYRGVLDGKARAVFQGRITVSREAQKSDGRMLNRTLLLSEGAEIDSKPELEIYADDVACAHGATAGELDAEALFYLRSRGLAEQRARALLVEGFLAEAVESMSEPLLREALEARLATWLAALEEPS